MHTDRCKSLTEVPNSTAVENCFEGCPAFRKLVSGDILAGTSTVSCGVRSCMSDGSIDGALSLGKEVGEKFETPPDCPPMQGLGSLNEFLLDGVRQTAALTVAQVIKKFGTRPEDTQSEDIDT